MPSEATAARSTRADTNCSSGSRPSATLPQQLAGLPRGLSERTSVAGTTAYGLSTSLFNVIAWQHGKVTVVAAGMVPKATLQAFVAAVR